MQKTYKDYLYESFTISLCPYCMKRVEGKIIIKDGSVYINKFCAEHGDMTELLEEDAEYYKLQARYSKPGTVCKTQTKYCQGCPFDCGLCDRHEQHTCIGLIEVTNACDLKCPVCYASAGSGKFLDMKTIESMMDFFQDSEFGMGEILQISGGEPTLHPEILDIIRLGRKKNFKYVMLNTHGLRLAEDLDFVKSLQEFSDGKFEVYLQFDGFEPETYKYFRGKDISEMKMKAIENLIKYEIPITLVSTIENGINDHEMGKIIEFGLKTKFIRGVNFQPVAYFGRVKEARLKNRLTVSGVMARIEKQMNGMIRKTDFVPLPCHPERVAFTYLYRDKGSFIPITRNINTEKYVPIIKNTFTFVPEDYLNSATADELSCCGKGCNCFDFLKDIRGLLPFGYALKSKQEKMKHINENTFRVSVVSFVDAYNFDIKSMKKECVHIITPDLKKIPFSAYNMIHRKSRNQISEIRRQNLK